MGDKMGGPACHHVQRDESAAPVPPAGAATWAPLGAARAGVPGSSPQASPLPSGRPDGWQGRRDSRSAPLPGTEVSVRKSPATGCGAVGRAARGPGGRDQVGRGAPRMAGACVPAPPSGPAAGTGPHQAGASLGGRAAHSQGSAREPSTEGPGPPGPGPRASLPGPWLQTKMGRFAQLLPGGTELRPGSGEGVPGKVPPGLAWQVEARTRRGSGRLALPTLCTAAAEGAQRLRSGAGPFAEKGPPCAVATIVRSDRAHGRPAGRPPPLPGLGFVSGRGRAGIPSVPWSGGLRAFPGRSGRSARSGPVASAFVQGRPER